MSYHPGNNIMSGGSPDERTPEQMMADKLDELGHDHAVAVRKMAEARKALTLATLEEQRTLALYQRQALWIKADELRKELAKTENAAAKITL